MIIARKVTECHCEVCRDMCRRSPCIPTPDDVERLIAAGYKHRLALTFCPDEKNNGAPLPCIAPIRSGTMCGFFYKIGLCELHRSGLKPTEGKLAIHNMPDGGLRRAILYTWMTEKGLEVMSQFAGTQGLIPLMKEVMKEIKWTSTGLQKTN